MPRIERNGLSLWVAICRDVGRDVGRDNYKLKG